MKKGGLGKLEGRIRVKDAQCPKGHSLMSGEVTFDGQQAVCIKIRKNGKSGLLYLNPFYGKYEYKTEFLLKDGDVLDVFCPECDVSLLIEEICRLCNIPMFAVHLSDGGQVEACPKVGCHNHSLTIVDLDEQLGRMYVDETKYQM